MAATEPVAVPAEPVPETPDVKKADVAAAPKKPDVEDIVKEGNVSANEAAKADQEEEVKGRALFTWRTGLSALAYGIIGALVGRVLGRWGDFPDRPVGARLLPWVGGGLGVFLAAFTSTQTARREQREEAHERRAAREAQLAAVHAVAPPMVAPELAPEPTPEPTPAPTNEKPMVHVATVERTGTVASAEHTRPV